MTYFGFLALFIGIPLVILALLHWRDSEVGRHLPASMATWSPGFAIAVHVVIAVVYTTPWDNYLVATGVWWYDPELVTGIVFGWVPIEEYTFFVLQTVFTSLWLLYFARRLATHLDQKQQPPVGQRGYALRLGSTAIVGIIWAGSVIMLVSGWQPGTYLGLELAWALPPIMLQLAFGADILWRFRRLVFWALVPSTVYLCIADAIAIGSGTWTIDPAQSTGIMLGVLPLEEIIFFLLTNTLVVFGVTLLLAQASQYRVPQSLVNWLARVAPQAHGSQSNSAQSGKPQSNKRGLSNV
jgi:lycopene beta-cyclase